MGMINKTSSEKALIGTIRNNYKKDENIAISIINNNQRIVEISDKQRHLINITNPISMTPQIRRYNLIHNSIIKKIVF